MTLDFRPLSIPELLDRSVSLYRRHLFLFVGIMAVPAAISLLFTVPLEVFSQLLTVPVAGADEPAEALAAGAVAVAGFGVAVLVYGVAYILALGATSYAVSDLYQGGAPTIGGTYRRVRAHGFDLVMLSLHVGLRLGIAMIALPLLGTALTGLLAQMIGAFAVLFMVASFAVGGVLALVLALRYSLSVPSLVLERLRAGPAIKRSVALTRGSLVRAFLIFFCATMITYAGLLLFQGPFAFGAMLVGPGHTLSLVLGLAGVVVGTLGSTLVAPIMIVGLVVLYFDARVRNEALDVQMMIANVDRADTIARGGLAPPTPAQ